MIAFPNAKINLGLHIVSKRGDGYHDLETLFYPIPLCDALEIIPSTESTSLQVDGIELDCQSDDNIVFKAYRALEMRYNLPQLSIRLLKKIPSGAGLGGGSADAAFMIRLLCEMYHLPLEMEQMEKLANQLGADCPFFITNRPAIATGTGNLLSPIELSLKGKVIIIVKPPIHISTKEAFAKIIPNRPSKSIATIIKQDIGSWRNELVNDFEASIFALYPELSKIKDRLYEIGAQYAAMSGSGSAIYGIFDHEIILSSEWNNYFTFQGVLE